MTTKKTPTEFTLQVIKVISKIPHGKVATYKQVAALAGREHASRAVVWILNTCTKNYKLPWQRVISARGKIAFDRRASNFRRQRRLLIAEGVDVELNGEINLTRFGYKKKPRIKPGTPKMFS